MKSARHVLTTAGVLLAFATCFGAAGAHALKSRLAPDALEIYETAVNYHFYNALGLLGIGLALRQFQSRFLQWSGSLVLSGIVVFSGSLYAVSLGAPRWLGAITPVGGLALIAGWLLFAVAMGRSRA